MKRTKLADRQLPAYSPAQEQMNALTHAAGAVLGVLVLLSCVAFAAMHQNIYGIVSCTIYGITFITMFTISSIYHGLLPSLAKKIMQVIDHCTIYFLIAGTYTAIVLSALRPVYPVLAWGLFAFEWGLAILAATFTAIDLKKYNTFSMICYIGMGWAVIPFWKKIWEVMEPAGFFLLLSGGIVYTIGSVLYGLGRKHPWMHTAFHVFVVLGAFLQYLSVLLYAV